MKTFVKTAASVLFVLSFIACSPQATDEAVSAATTETAAEFVSRANAELAELNKEIGAA
ncbi:MAG: hypothetical protein IIC12_08110, partial [Proteobacteria bacterium]|nr:hypothetical protein [Pseudomonadota bacterium]